MRGVSFFEIKNFKLATAENETSVEPCGVAHGPLAQG